MKCYMIHNAEDSTSLLRSDREKNRKRNIKSGPIDNEVPMHRGAGFKE